MDRLFIVGAAKSGTTTLFYYLNKHPELYFSPVKEPNFFSNTIPLSKHEKTDPVPGKEYHAKVITERKVYDQLFQNADKKSHKLLCEASTSYLFDPNSANLIFNEYPDSKIIVIVRNPVKRAYSHYRMYYKLGVEKEPDFKKALLREFNKKEKILGRDFPYVAMGKYYEQIKRYYDVFPRENIHVIVFEEFIKDITSNLKILAEFLAISSKPFEEMDGQIKLNQSTRPRNTFIKSLLIFKRNLSLSANLIPAEVRKRIRKFLFAKDEHKEIPENAEIFIKNALKDDLSKLSEFIPEAFVKKHLLK